MGKRGAEGRPRACVELGRLPEGNRDMDREGHSWWVGLRLRGHRGQCTAGGAVGDTQCCWRAVSKFTSDRCPSSASSSVSTERVSLR